MNGTSNYETIPSETEEDFPDIKCDVNDAGPSSLQKPHHFKIYGKKIYWCKQYNENFFGQHYLAIHMFEQHSTTEWCSIVICVISSISIYLR